MYLGWSIKPTSGLPRSAIVDCVKAMIINSKTGEVIIGEAHFDHGLVEDEFLNSSLGKFATPARMSESRNWYHLWLTDPSGREAGVVLCFLRGGKLQQCRLKLVKSRSNRGFGWSDSGEDGLFGEEGIKVFHDKLLRGQLGEPPYDFRWGWATSVIDDHDSSAVIIIAYGPCP